jgi:hypothetical protein
MKFLVFLVLSLPIACARDHTRPDDERPAARATTLAIIADAAKTAVVPIDANLGEKLWPKEQETADEIACTIEDQIHHDYPIGKRPVRRDAHPKAHGCVKAVFAIDPNIQPDLAHGVFRAGKSYSAWIRFSNGAADPTKPDFKGDARGMAIKLLEVGNTSIMPAEDGVVTQDFIMINHPVFFIDDPQDYLSLIKKINDANPLAAIAIPAVLGVKGSSIALALGRKRIGNPLATRYWSMVPYRLGDNVSKQVIKFSAKPCGTPENAAPKTEDPDYLRKAMATWLGTRDACFEFLVQPRTSDSMEVENSMTEWNEEDAPFFKVATITIPKQGFESPEQMRFCDNLSYTPWHALPAHRPLGGVNRVRRVVYERISKLRHALNSVPRTEPRPEN